MPLNRYLHVYRRPSWLLLLLTGLSLNASAQVDTVDDEAVEIKRYTVELIVFAYNENVSMGTEVFPPDPPPELPLEDEFLDEEILEDDTIEDVVEAVIEPDPMLVEDVDPRLETVFLEREDFTMQEVYGHLRRLDVYQPLMHVAWTQPGLAPEVSEPMDLSVFGEPPEGLTGSFTLYLGRYLHLVVDLTLDGPEQEVLANSFGDERTIFPSFAEPVISQVRYRIDEDRIIKNEETRYFDHPKFGVIAKVTRYEEPELETDEEFLLPPLTGSAGQSSQ